ncbi:MAG: exonuclease domain-containing protein [Nanoarchaeota archaeon]
MNSQLLRFDENKTLLFIDVETENLCLNLKLNRFWEIAYILVKGKEIIKQQQYYVKWDKPIKVGAEAAKVTGFDQKKYDELSIDQETVFKDVYEKMESADFIAGHNIIGFDLNFIVQWYQIFGKPWKHLVKKVIDTNSLARGIKMNIPFKSGDNLTEYQYKIYHNVVKGVKSRLSLLADEFGIEYDPNRLHSALDDLKLNIAVWNKIKYKIQI